MVDTSDDERSYNSDTKQRNRDERRRRRRAQRKNIDLDSSVEFGSSARGKGFNDVSLSSPERLGNRLAKLRNQRQAFKEASKKPEVHIIGTLVGGVGFGTGVTCKWRLEKDASWDRLEGEDHGQTQTDYPNKDSELAVWAHPIDIHYATSTMKGWPRFVVEVWSVDEHGRSNCVGYGYVLFLLYLYCLYLYRSTCYSNLI